MPTPAAELDLPEVSQTDLTRTGESYHSMMRELRERSWIARLEGAGYLVLGRDAAAHFMRAKEATFPATQMLELQGITEGPLYDYLSRNLLELDGDAHRRLRKLVQPAFTPAAADRQRPAMRTHLASLWDAVSREGKCDIVASFSRPYPSRMIAEVMGAPLEDAPRLERWANMIQGQFDPIRVASEREALESAAAEFHEYAWELLALRREAPGDDLLSELIAMEAEGDRLSEQEVVDLASAVLVGGVDTTQAQLAHGIRLFCENPDAWRKLADDPAIAPAAVEEVLRFEPIAPLTLRMLTADAEWEGVSFPIGTIIVAAAVTANREEGAVSEPERFDILADRARAKPLTFGAGPHFCLGANLARAELVEAFGYLAPRMPGLELDGEVEYASPLGIYGLERLPVRWRDAG